MEYHSIIAAIVSIMSGLNAIWLYQDYRKIKMKDYQCYYCKVDKYISNQQLMVKGPLEVEVIYNDKKLYKKERNIDIVVMKFQDNWYGVDPKYNDK